METRQVLELVGYAASALVVVSLMMSSLLKLRVVNLVGSATFALYGLLIHAYPVAATNGFIVLINLYYLRQMLRTREFFRVLPVRPHSEYLRYFLEFYAEDVQRFQPAFRYAPEEGHLTFFVLRDATPAGLFIGEARDGSLCVLLDYVIPQYRDFKTGSFLFNEQAGFFRERGIREILSPAGSPAQATYLRRMGFEPIGPRDGVEMYRLAVAG
ncbi:MAG TPA: hypothetical protein VFQ39_04485 [Longimicrobium sp.]|nr:hypothetical protein [Longimicrobium sp.]